MSTKTLKILAIILPVIFFLGVLVLRESVAQNQTSLMTEVVTLLPVLVGSVLFSSWVFSIINRREQEMAQQSDQLAALHQAALALTMELDLATVLQKVVDQARLLSSAEYGALGVVEEGVITQFITSGMDPGERGKINHHPVGKGLLGVMLYENESVRIPDIAKDPRAVGFPQNHPVMIPFLGVPVHSKGKTIGNLYLTNKRDKKGSLQPFALMDQRLLEMFAAQAAIAIENAQLYRQTQQLTVLQERERFAMNLHDGIIQSIYAIGLMLEDADHRMAEEPDETHNGINRAIHGMNDVIRDIRNYILDLRPQRFQGRDLWTGLEELARDFRANTFLNVEIFRDGSDMSQLTPEQTVEVLHICQEALTNVRKHDRASLVEIGVSMENDVLIMTIEDNGVGMDYEGGMSNGGNGLRNMKERANTLSGKVHFGPCESGGTCVYLYVPLVMNGKDA